MTRPRMESGDVHLIRRLNRDAVLGLIQDRSPISRTALARLTDLTAATAFSIVDELMGEGLVRELGRGKSEGGRRPALFAFNPSARLVIGVDIWRQQILGVLTDLDGQIQRTVSRDHDLGSAAEIIQLLDQVLEELIAAAAPLAGRLIGIGVAVPGLVDASRGVVRTSRFWGWQDYPLGQILFEKFRMPICVEVDDKALAVGESYFGAGRGVPNVICIKIGRGLGAGFILNGSLLRGPDNTTGELGHMMIDPAGPRCYCGNYGCLTQLVTDPAICERTERGLRLGAISSLRERVDGDLSRITTALVAEAANAGDPFACQVMEETGRYLGIGIATLVNLLNPDLVILGGSVMLTGAPLLTSAQQVVQLRTHREPGRRVRIVPATLGVEAAAIGAATLVMLQEGVRAVRTCPPSC